MKMQFASSEPPVQYTVKCIQNAEKNVAKIDSFYRAGFIRGLN